MIAILLSLTAALPQGGGLPQIPDNLRPVLTYPESSAEMRFAPFVDALGQPVVTEIAAAGAADLDGDENTDLWFLSASGINAGELSVQMAKTSSLGRFRHWHSYPRTPWSGAATYRSQFYTRDRILLIDPMSRVLTAAYYSYPPNTPPRQGQFQMAALPWQIGIGAYQIDTRDDDGDGHDDIAVARDLGSGWTQIRKLHMSTKRGSLQPESEVSGLLPFRLEFMRMLDLNGDGRSDLIGWIPGIGVLGLLDSGAGYFAFHSFLYIPAGLRNLTVGDQDGDNRDDFVLVADNGLALIRSTAVGLHLTVVTRPQAVGAFKSALITDADSDGLIDLIGFPADGKALVIYQAAVAGGFLKKPRVEVPSDPSNYQGPGTLGVQVFGADLDNDGDQDALLQLPSGDSWLSLNHPEKSFAPTRLTVVDQGKVGETGFIKQLLTVQMPTSVTTLGLQDVEAAVFLQDPQNKTRYLYWGRVTPRIDLKTGTASFSMYFQTNKQKLPAMISQAQPNQFQNGLTAGGEALLSIHAKLGPKRFESLAAFQKGGGGSKSAKGVQWAVKPAPPKPSLDDELLPWN